MPKVSNTRKQRAGELLNRIKRGPAFYSYPTREFNSEEAARQYRSWVQSWIIEELINLVPELKDLKGESNVTK